LDVRAPKRILSATNRNLRKRGSDVRDSKNLALFDGEGQALDDATRGILVLFLGVMFGVRGASDAIAKVSTQVAATVARRLPRQALTKGAVYPVVKKVAGYLGVAMTKETFGKSVAKAVPLVGGVVSGGITLASYVPMCRKLKNHLATLAPADPAGVENAAFDSPLEEKETSHG
jgi:hypothetical protein